MWHEPETPQNRCACCPGQVQPIILTAAPIKIQPLSALASAGHLRVTLSARGIAADVHEGRGLALVSVWAGLVVWTDGLWFRWWTGALSRKGRWLYAYHSAFELERAADRISVRYADLRGAHRPSYPTIGIPL